MQLSTWYLCFISAGHAPCDNFFGSLATPHSRSSVAWRQKSVRPWIPTEIFPHLLQPAQPGPICPSFPPVWVQMMQNLRKRRRQWQKSVNDAKSATTMQKVALKSLLLHPLLLHQQLEAKQTLFSTKKWKISFYSDDSLPFHIFDRFHCQMAALLGPSWKSRQPRMCQYCQRMFSNKFNLKQHILNMHTVGRELACEICQKKVKNKWYLRRHHVTHHGAPLKKWEKDRDHLRGQYPYHMLYDPFRLSWKKLISFHRASPENPRKFSAMQPSANNMGTIIVFNGITSYRCTTIIVFVPFNNHRPDIYSHTVKSRCPECKNKSVLYHFLCMSIFFIKWFFKHKKKILVASNWNKKIKVMATPSRLQEIMMHFERHCEEKDDFQFRTGPFSLDSYQAAINEIVNASPSLWPPLSMRWMPIQIGIPS